MPAMTSKQRFLTAMRGGTPDRVPVAPDTSNYIPAKRSKLPFWDIYFNGVTPLWKEYLKTIDYFGADYWVNSCWYSPLVYEDSPHITRTQKDHYDAALDAMVRDETLRTPDGELTGQTVCLRADPPTPVRKVMKDIARDWKAFRWTQRVMPTGINTVEWNEVRQECTKRNAAFGVSLGYPGFQQWLWAADGGIEALSYAAIDCPEILDEWYDLNLASGTRGVELILAGKPDYVLFGGSGTLTLSSPQLVMKYCIPPLKKWTKMCKDAGVPTLLHSCGKSRLLVDMLAEHTDLNMINPLEVPTMGDVDLAEVKRARGRQIGLMGNLHTVDVMLRGTPDLVRDKAKQAMRDAGIGGGFCLSTGDQCPRDTPDENLFALVQAAKEYGVYDQATGQLPRLM